MPPAKTKAIKLEDIMGRPVSLDECWEVADFLLACLTHVTNARPLFGVFHAETGELTWTAGGAEVFSILYPYIDEQTGINVSCLNSLMALFGIPEDDYADIVETGKKLAPGSSLSVMKHLVGRDTRAFRMGMRRRVGENAHEVQFSMVDVTPFRDTARRTQAMAEQLVKGLNAPLGDSSARDILDTVLQDLDALFALDDAEKIEALTQDMSTRVTQASQLMIQVLLSFEQDAGGAAQWQPQTLDLSLRPVISVHNLPIDDWHDVYNQVLVIEDGVPSIIADLADRVKLAYSFVCNATSTMLISPTEERYFALNGPAAGKQFSTIEELVRGIGVEENSTRTAVEFFSGLKEEPKLGLFAVNGENVQAWGRPGLYGGWQSTLVPAMQTGRIGGVDVRGLFHGLKNLLLHLQVLYVVKTRKDVDEVREGLTETSTKIHERLSDLERITKTGKRVERLTSEYVGQWLSAAKKVEGVVEGEVEVVADDAEYIKIPAVASEMEDTMEELVRNAFQHGADLVVVGAMKKGDHLCMHVTDNGPGMSDDKFEQLQNVLENRVYDPELSTRTDGTGNGLLSAAQAVSRFVDGHLGVTPGPGGKGVKVHISMKLPT
ncbi:ATP-binding protein [Magnetovibrio sp. PR-2]|uniref:ATP-binding protein n=1 Tax=Magnetovibrio sp. PR-2 TaxID=3120356 RepID=UPI002FCE20A4